MTEIELVERIARELCRWEWEGEKYAMGKMWKIPKWRSGYRRETRRIVRVIREAGK